ncbi:unnamed protein product [Calypogeia fissa]
MSATPPAMEELERVVGGKGSVDLVTVAQAMHWFDLEKFYSVVKHVLRKPGGVVAAWCYGNPNVTPEVDKVIYESVQDVRAILGTTDKIHRRRPQNYPISIRRCSRGWCWASYCGRAQAVVSR